MKINQLKLLDFRCFKSYTLKPADRFTLLIGDNGSGKTAILDALAISIGDLLLEMTGIKATDKYRISLNDMHHVELTMGQTALKETATNTFISFYAVIGNKPIHWINGRGIKKFFCLSKGDLDGVTDDLIKGVDMHVDFLTEFMEEKNNPKNLFPIAAYYGTGRLWQQLKPKDKKTIGPSSRFDSYKNSLNSASDQKSFFQWFKTQELAALQKQERRHVLEAVRGAIISMIPDAKRAWWDLDWDELRIEIFVQGQLKTVPFSLLSDGYRNMIGMVADIAYRMATLNPQLEDNAIKQTEGIVLIDELDLHLHPNWQKQVVGRLLDTFPKIQFVATSHSPFIIQSLYHRDDCLLWDLETNAPVTVDSKSIEDIAENQQGVEIPQQSQRFLDMEKAAEEYYTVLKQIPPASEDEKQRLRQRLDELLMPYSDDPAFQAFLKMERLAVEGNKPV
ncbi:MAG: AAA family ATPase [Methylococcales bacterium]|nr:AAA family ATPase [Methylococcales bacterium]